MSYISTKCLRDKDKPFDKHDDCVTGPSVFNIGEREYCTCHCHDATKAKIDAALASGLTPSELRKLWYAERGGIAAQPRPFRSTRHTGIPSVTMACSRGEHDECAICDCRCHAS